MELNNFELNHMDIEQNANSNLAQESIVLDDLLKQVEDLQQKLKLSYKKLFLFETENQKILKDKNFYFYEKSNLEEQLKMTLSKNENLSAYSKELEQELNHTTEKMNAFENLTQTQGKDLRRLTKFYAKIQDVIKPYIQNLKTDLSKQASENTQLSRINFQYLELTEALNQKNTDINEKMVLQSKQFEFEKKNLVSSYEEQIHFLSKEIIDFQQKISFAESETLRLKKSNETKNYIENELVKFKRSQAEDQLTIQNLKLRQNELLNQQASVATELSDIKSKYIFASNEAENQRNIIDMTRQQLSRKIEDAEHLELRLKMLERLNSHLSVVNSDSKARNFEEHQITL